MLPSGTYFISLMDVPDTHLRQATYGGRISDKRYLVVSVWDDTINLHLVHSMQGHEDAKPITLDQLGMIIFIKGLAE